jgi:histidine triad (HIT) family protein
MSGYDSQNIFAKILRGEIPCKEIYRDAFALAFYDIAPAAPVHALVIPTGEYRSFDDFVTHASAQEQLGFFAAVQKVAAMLGLQENGYRLISNHGAHAGQLVAHFHVHILGGKKLGGLVCQEKE